MVISGMPATAMMSPARPRLGAGAVQRRSNEQLADLDPLDRVVGVLDPGHRLARGWSRGGPQQGEPAEVLEASRLVTWACSGARRHTDGAGIGVEDGREAAARVRAPSGWPPS